MPKQFPCKSCGANLEFDPDAASLQCPYCGFTEEIPQTEKQIQEYAYNERLATKSRKGYGEAKRVAKCKECQAETAVDPQTEATRCAYCDSPMVIEDKRSLEDLIQPEAVLPFKLEKPQAERAFHDWIKGLWFAPNALKRTKALAKMHGVYRPYWTFDTHTANAYSGMRGDYYTVTVGSGKNRRQERRVRWTPVSGRFNRFFDDVLIDAGRGQSWADDFDLGALKPYDPRLLAGYEAETYSVPLDQGWVNARKTIDAELHSDACRRIGGDTQRGVTVTTAYNAVTYKHVLLPLYCASYRYGKKAYAFQVNGQTGKVRGERPWSFWKIFFAVLGGLAIVGAIVWIVMKNQ